jgi:autotransporter adhesin
VTLANLAAGAVTATSTQAINGSQLYGTANSIAANFGGGSKVNANGTVSAPSYAIGGSTFNNVGGALNAVNNSLNAFNNSLSNLQGQISQNVKLANAGTAVALAASGLRYDDRPGKISTAIGASGYSGQGGIAGGFGWTSLDGQWRANLGASFSPTIYGAGVGVNGAVSFTWN